jgi:riboflavin kinase
MSDQGPTASTPAERPENRPKVVDPEDGPREPFPICIQGEVVKGFGRGSKELGIPTANLSENAIPQLLEHAQSGIYYGLARVLHADSDADDAVHKMVMSVGWNPFYKNTVRSAEVHIMHKFAGDFYGKQLKVIVIGFIRPEYNYTSMESLVEDINEDMQVCRRSLQREAYKQYFHDQFLLAEGKL